VQQEFSGMIAESDDAASEKALSTPGAYSTPDTFSPDRPKSCFWCLALRSMSCLRRVFNAARVLFCRRRHHLATPPAPPAPNHFEFHRTVPALPQLPHVNLVTFNVLAPIYKTSTYTPHRVYESEWPEHWMSRHTEIARMLASLQASIVCLQEFWFKEELFQLYRSHFHDASTGADRYAWSSLRRTGHKKDGLVTLVSRQGFRVVDEQSLDYGDRGLRVALLTRIAMDVPVASEFGPTTHRNDFIVVNNHLTFSHCCFDVQLRGVQGNNYATFLMSLGIYMYSFFHLRVSAQKLIAFIRSYVDIHNLHGIPIFIAGDFNGASSSHFLFSNLVFIEFNISCLAADDNVTQHLRLHNFESSFRYSCGREAGVTHLNHRGESVPVDYIWTNTTASLNAQSGGSAKPFMQFVPTDSYLLPQNMGDQVCGVFFQLAFLQTNQLNLFAFRCSGVAC
jgi:hypothetical protein